MSWTIEEPTRQAQLLAAETPLTECSKDLVDGLVSKGYKLIRSRQVVQQAIVSCGGMYVGSEEKATGRYTAGEGTTGKLDRKSASSWSWKRPMG